MTQPTPQEDQPVALTNTVRAEDAYNDIKNALGDSARFLKQFCGPFALNAGTIASTQTAAIDNFTKDGVTIYSHLSARTPVEETARRLIEFIGKRVDNRCHDGTTTSMMTAATLGYHWMETLSPKSRRDRHTAAKSISDIVDIFDKTIDEQSFTVDELVEEVKKLSPQVDEDDLRRRIFYDTIMTSSKGDTELSEKLSLVLESLPSELYSYARFEHNNVEADHRFEIKEQESDFQIRGNYCGNPSTLPGNKHMGASFLMEEANLVLIPNPVIDRQFESDYLVSYIANALLPTKKTKDVEIPVLDADGKPKINEEGHPAYKLETQEVVEPAPETLDKPLILLAPRFESMIIRVVNAYNDSVTDWNKKIFMFQFHQEDPRSYHAMCRAIAVIAGKTDDDYYMLTEAANAHDFNKAMIPCKFEQGGNLIDIYNLYTRDDRKFHPFYYDESQKRYHALLEEMQDTIKHFSKGNLDADKRMEKFTYDLIYIQRCMICQKIIEMRVCGTAHELTANSSVVEDAMGSALSVVEDGVVLSGYQKILSAVRGVPEANPMLEATEKALTEVVAAAYDLTPDEVNQYKTSLIDFNGIVDRKFLYNNAFDEAPFTYRNAVEEFAKGESNAILQPRAGYKEQFVRIRDIISKLVMTYAVLTERKFDRNVGR